MLERAKQKKSIVKNFIKLENYSTQKEKQETENEAADGNADENTDDFDLLHGIENEQIHEMKEKIRKSKAKKGRGLLLSFYEFN